jgi:hypothetical protein
MVIYFFQIIKTICTVYKRRGGIQWSWLLVPVESIYLFILKIIYNTIFISDNWIYSTSSQLYVYEKYKILTSF